MKNEKIRSTFNGEWITVVGCRMSNVVPCLSSFPFPSFPFSLFPFPYNNPLTLLIYFCPQPSTGLTGEGWMGYTSPVFGYRAMDGVADEAE